MIYELSFNIKSTHKPTPEDTICAKVTIPGKLWVGF